MSKKRLLAGVLFMILADILASLMFVWVKLSVSSVNPLLIAEIQFVVCVVLLLPAVAIWRNEFQSLDNILLHLLRGGSGAFSFVLFYKSISYSPIVNCTLLNNTAPIWVPIIARLWLSEKVTRGHWVGILIASAGVAIVLQPKLIGSFLGNMLALMSGVLMSVSFVATRKLTFGGSVLAMLFIYSVVASLVLLPFSLPSVSDLTWTTAPPLLGLGVIMLFLQISIVSAFSRAEASVVTPLTYLTVIFTGTLGWLIWGFVPSLWAVFGTVLVISGGLTVILASHRLATP